MSQAGTVSGGGGPGSPYISLSPFIVGPDIHSGYATIGAAIAAAVADGASSTNPKNIYIKPQNGGYTEDLTLSDGINLVGFGEATVIKGKNSISTGGTVSITGLFLETNGDYLIEVTGAGTTEVNVFECFINAVDANAIHCTNASGLVMLEECFGDCFTNTYFVFTGGGIRLLYCILVSSLNTTTNSTLANAAADIYFTLGEFPITTSGAGGALGVHNSSFLCTNTTAFTNNGLGSSIINHCRVESGTASTISIGAGAVLPVVLCSIESSNVNALTGAGEIKYAFITFTGSSSGVNVTTQTAFATLI